MAIVTVGNLPPDGADAVGAAGGRVLAAFGWDGVDELAVLPSDAASAVVIAAVPAAIGHGPLELLATLLEQDDRDAVIVFAPDTLEAVAAVLFGHRITLLCNPDPGDWTTALVLATHRAGAGALSASVREGEAARLRRMHEEVARIAAQLTALAGRPDTAAGDGVGDRRLRYAAGADRDVAVDPTDIRRAIRARRLRAQFFDNRLLEDPGWDMLLDLFAAELEGNRVSVSSLCIAAAVAPTTALRWIGRMAEAGLLVRLADAGDRRRAFVALSGGASDAMRGYVGAATQAGLSVA